MPWDSSMHGVPWTPKKMRDAVAILREGGSVTFAFGGDPLWRLRQLDEEVLCRRPDLLLHVWSVASKNFLSDEEFEVLASLKHVKHLRMSMVTRPHFEMLGEMRRLESLEFTSNVPLCVSFIEKLTRLRRVDLWAKVDDLSALASCPRLTSLELSGSLGDLSPLSRCVRLKSLRFGQSTLGNFGFVAKLGRLTKLEIDSADIACKLDPIGELSKLTELRLSSNRNLRNVEFLGSLVGLKKLRVSQPRVVRLPDLSQLKRLEVLELAKMSMWTNPEVLESLPRVRSITLNDINPKLAAEKFLFLATSKKMRSLREVDIRFIDFATRRRAALQSYFAKAAKKGLVVKA